MKTKFYILLVLIFAFQQYSFSQNRHMVDSLLSILKNAKADTSRVKVFIKLSDQFLNSNYDTALYFASEAKALAEKIDYQNGIGNGCVMIATASTNLGKYENALKNSHEALGIFDKLLSSANASQKTRLLNKKAYVYNLIGAVYQNQGNYPEALKMYFSSLKIKEEIRDKSGMAASYNNIGIIYEFQCNYPEALKNYFLSLKIEEETGNKIGLADSYSNIAVVYSIQGNQSEALKNHLAALKIREEIGDKRGLITSYTNLGNLYFYSGNYPEAIKTGLASLRISEEIGDQGGIASSCNNLGKFYRILNKKTEALHYLNKGLTCAKEIGSLKEIHEIYGELAAFDSANGNFKQALIHYKLFIITRDSMLNNENTQKITRQQMQYEFEKKESLTKAEQEKKDAVAQQELQTQKFVRNAFIVGFIIVLLFAGVFFRQRNKIKKGNAALQAAKDRAERSEQFKQQFLANMSHEIRTPMNAVMGMTSLVLDTPLQERQKFYLEGIKKSSDTLLHIINDILDLSKIEAGKMELETIDFSLSESLNQLKQTLNHRAEEKGLELLVSIDPRLSDVVTGDPVRLNQVLINLAGNAIKFTEKGSVSIEVTRGEAESAIQFSVIDTGIGIPQEKLQTVFENFSQANASDTRKYGGTGLGLSISRQLVELMGGKISIASVEGSGTTFSFVVTFEKGSPDRLEQRLASEEQVDGAILDGLSILVVDDNEYNRIVAKDTLESKSKASVVAVGSALEALELLKAKDFDVVLMDVQMPGMDGFEGTRAVRSRQLAVRNPSVPIIALTASVLRTDLDKCTAAGMNGYIPKPFRASQLIIGIAQVLNIPLRARKKIETKTAPNPTVPSGVTNLDYLTKFCEGDPVRIRKYIGMFLASVPALLEKISVAAERNDHVEIASQMHSFKTKFMMMGMKQAQELALEIEMRCMQEKTVEPVKLKLEELVLQIGVAVKELESGLM